MHGLLVLQNTSRKLITHLEQKMNWQDFLTLGFVFQGVIVSGVIPHFSGSLPGARWTPLPEPGVVTLVRGTHVVQNVILQLQKEMEKQKKTKYN